MSDLKDQSQNPAITDYKVRLPKLDAVSEGYSYAGVNADGFLQEAPDPMTFRSLQSFSDNLHDSTWVSHSADTVKYLNDEYYNTLNSMGISSDASKGENFRPVGMDSTGRRMFSTQNMLSSGDYQFGSKIVNGATDVIKGFDYALGKATFDDAEVDTLNNVAKLSQDSNIVSTLDDLKSNKDSQTFIDTIFDLFSPSKTKVTKQAVASGKGLKGDEDPMSVMDSIGVAYNSYALFESWDYLSSAQKAAGLATVGMKSAEMVDGTKLGEKVLVDATYGTDGKLITPELNVGDSLALFNAGINSYGLAKNWDQLSDISRLVTGLSTVSSISKVADKFGMLGKGVTNAAATVKEGALAQAGFSATPQYGIGAIMGPSNAGIPDGYTAVAYADELIADSLAFKPLPEFGTEAAANFGSAANSSVTGAAAGKQVIATPTANAASSKGLTTGAGSTLNTAAGIAGVAYGAYKLYEGWGEGGSKGAKNGLLGGASMAGGLYALGATNPYLLAGVVAVSALSGLVKTGKSKDQKDRDTVRAKYKRVGIADDDWNVTLADGSKYNIGVDGHGNQREWSDPDKARAAGGDPSKKLNAYDVDYTNDSNYIASLGGTSLARIISGGTQQAVEQMGGQLSNAFISNIDSKGELTEDKFNKIVANQRAVAARIGLKTKAGAYALSNMMYKEGRINDTQLVQMQQSFDIMYDDDAWGYVQTLNEGRWRGIEVANTHKNEASKEESKAMSAASKKNRTKV